MMGTGARTVAAGIGTTARRETVAIFMPTLNEIDGVRAVVPRISRDWYDEMIVVDGHSTDGTVEYLRSQGLRVELESRRGVVNAYNQGFHSSCSDIFVTMTPDGNCIPELLPELIREIRKGYDIVFVSRYLPPACSHDDGIITAVGNYVFTRIVNMLFHGRYTDLLGGFRAYRRNAVEAMRLDTQPEENWLTRRYDLLNTWEIGGCIRAAKLKLKVKEIPGEEPARIGGESKVNILRNGSFIVAQILYELLIGKRFLRRPVAQTLPQAAGERTVSAVRTTGTG